MGLFDRLFGNRSVSDLTDAVSNAVVARMAEAFRKDFAALQEVEDSTAQVIELRKQIATLENARDSIKEGYERKEREIEHKVGLIRQEMEAKEAQDAKLLELKLQEAKLDAREVGLTEREKAFTEKMSFIERRFTEEVGYLKDMVKNMSDRLPDATILATKEL